jgi:hypothetical protein
VCKYDEFMLLMLQAKSMVGYVTISRERYLGMLADPVQINNITVYILDGGQQTRGMQKAIITNAEVAEFREQKKNFPMLKVYAGLEMEHEDFATVIYYQYF